MTFVYPQTKWFKYEGNPVLVPGASGSWDSREVLSPRVIYMNDSLKMWYTGSSHKLTGERIGYAWSLDGGVTWKKHPANPVFKPSQSWENNWIYSSYVVYQNKIYKMWYTGNDGYGEIGFATSPDGITWIQYEKNPVLIRGPLIWDEQWMAFPMVIGSDSFRMWYEGHTLNIRNSYIGYAYSPYETSWTKYKRNPILSPVPGAWESSHLRFPRVLFDGHSYQMWYSGGDNLYLNHKFGYATSLDGINWERFSGNPVMQANTDSWEEASLMMPEILFDGSIYHMWYCGYNNGNKIGYAISPAGIDISGLSSIKYVPSGGSYHMVVKTVDPIDFTFTVNVKAPPRDRFFPDRVQQIDNVLLYDDGKHDDGLANDGLFANIWKPKEENVFIFDLTLTQPRQKKQINFNLNNAGSFTNIGPIDLADIQLLGNTEPQPGDTAYLKLSFLNHGKMISPGPISVTLSAGDSSLIKISPEPLEYNYEVAGEKINSNGYFTLYVDPDCPTGSDNKIDLKISLLGINFFNDSFNIHVYPPWWQSYLGYGLLGLILLAGLLGIRNLELRRVKRKHLRELERVQLEKLVELDKLKSRFFANISHEFRTPLTLIEGPLKQMTSGDFKGDTAEQYNLMLRNTQRLTQLVNQLLDLSKIESGQMKLRVNEVDITEFIKIVAASFESLAVRMKMKFELIGCDKTIVGWCDTEALNKIVTNLLSNAFKFNNEGGRVVLSVFKESSGENIIQKNKLYISISDTGIGIPQDKLDKIFDRFYQVDDSHTRDHEGTGIGLALTKELIELHKGEIFVESQPGKGSTFTIKLPIGRNAYNKDEIIDEEEKPETITTKSLIEEEKKYYETEDNSGDNSLPILLLIEDNADMRQFIRKNLDKNFRILEAVNGEEGFLTSVSEIPDLIICDVMMPKMDGFQLCEKLKTDERTSHIPVILLTAKAGQENKLEGLEIGADDYLTKPFDTKELEVRIRNLIQQRKTLREKFKREITITPSGIIAISMDESFLQKIKDNIERNISNEYYSVEQLASEVGLSYTQLHRKLSALTNMSTGKFIRWFRLQRAMELLIKNAATIAEIGFSVGFSSPAYFTKCFKEEFGKLPSDITQGTET